MSVTRATLLAWHSKNHGLEVLSNALRLLEKRRHAVSRVVYLCRKSEPFALPKDWKGPPVEIITLPVKDPSSHREVYAAITQHVLPLVQGEVELHVNTSPGTPAMHSVWLLVHAGGGFPSGTRLWSSQREGRDGPVRIDPVDFPITTYLSEVRTAAAVRAPVAQYDPEAKSQARRDALENVARYAAIAGAPLLILGERGTGKTRLVETVVASIKRRDRVVTVPCGALDSALAEGELFGHVKGAFTGAEANRKGLLGSADGGILFLDEVQDLPKAVQRKLIRFLQDRDRRYRQVGGDKELTTDVEVVCASNLPITELAGRLDPDLFDRLSHLVVTLPALRDCREDIRDDWERVWKEMRNSEELPSESPWAPSLSKALSAHNLAGNLRDLQRLAVLIFAWWKGGSPTDAVTRALAAWQSGSAGVMGSAPIRISGEGSRSERTREFQRELARWAKAQHGTWARAAKALGCDERTLRADTEN